MLRSFTSRTSNSGGSGGSEDEWTPPRRQMKRMEGGGRGRDNMRRGRRRGAGALCIQVAVVTLNSELNEASSFSVRVDGVTGEEDRVLALCRLQLFEER